MDGLAVPSVFPLVWKAAALVTLALTIVMRPVPGKLVGSAVTLVKTAFWLVPTGKLIVNWKLASSPSVTSGSVVEGSEVLSRTSINEGATIVRFALPVLGPT